MAVHIVSSSVFTDSRKYRYLAGMVSGNYPKRFYEDLYANAKDDGHRHTNYNKYLGASSNVYTNTDSHAYTTTERYKCSNINLNKYANWHADIYRNADNDAHPY